MGSLDNKVFVRRKQFAYISLGRERERKRGKGGERGREVKGGERGRKGERDREKREFLLKSLKSWSGLLKLNP